MLWHLKTIVTLVRAFGLSSGIHAYTMRFLARFSPTATQVISAEPLAGKIYLRSRTSDFSLLTDILMGNSYALPMHYEGPVRKFADHVVAKGSVPLIIDCGANIGMSTIWFAQKYPLARIVAIEPDRDNFRLLELNTKPYSNVFAIHGAVFDKKTWVTLSNPSGQPWSWQTKEENGGDIETFTMQQLMAMEPNSTLLIIKIDIEGGEFDLFRSNTEWVSSSPVIVFEHHDYHQQWKGNAHAIFARLSLEPRDYAQSGELIFAFSHSHLARFS